MDCESKNRCIALGVHLDVEILFIYVLCKHSVGVWDITTGIPSLVAKLGIYRLPFWQGKDEVQKSVRALSTPYLSMSLGCSTSVG